MNKLKLLEKKIIYGFTPDKYCKNCDILDVVEKQLIAGVDIIQLREKQRSARELLRLAKEIKKLTTKHNKIFIVNDDVLIAKLSDADGVHLGQDDLDVSIAREILGSEKIIGLSTHNLEQYRAGQDTCADYTAIGPIFATKTKDNPDPVVGLEKLSEILNYKKKMTIAIGGINKNNIEQLLKYDIDGIAIVSAIVAAPDIFEAAQFFKKILKSSKR